MAKDDDLREKIHGLEMKQGIDDAVRERDVWWIKKLIAMCLVMWSAITYIGRELGSFLYDNYAPVRIGVDAAIAAWRARNG